MPPKPKYVYRPAYVEKLRRFFDIDAGHWVDGVNSKTGETTMLFVAADLPMISSFARSIGVPSGYINKWATLTDEKGDLRYPDFAEAYYDAKAHQERILVLNGLNGGYKTAFAIFTMKNVCGWRDAYTHQHQDVGDASVRPITVGMSPQEAAEAYADTLRGDRGDNVIPMKRRGT